MSDFPNVDKLRILHYPDPVLAEHAKPVAEAGSFHAELAQRMVELMVEAIGIGLAANQVGLLEQLIVLSPSGEPDKAEAYLNPRITAREGKVIEAEGCLSVPGVQARVPRAERITVVARRLNGEEVTMDAEGLIARAWQHEIDHLNGMLFVNKLGPASRLMIKSGLRRLEKAFREDHA